MKKTLQIVNPIALTVTIVINYVSTTGVLNGQTVGEIFAQYNSLVTPAGYAFSIWSLIYLMLCGFIVYQAFGLFKRTDNDDFVLKISWWFVISCLANCLWVITWVYELTGLSVLLMMVLLFALLKVVINTNMERWDAPLPTIFFLWWPFCLYSGWITVALIANISAWLTKIGWNGFGLSDVAWAVMMIVIAGIINLFMTWNRNMREFALVGMWGLIAVAAANWGVHQSIVMTAIVVSVVLLVNVALHGSQNKDTSPFVKWQEMRSETKR